MHIGKIPQQIQGYNSKVIKYDIYGTFGFYRFYGDYVTIATSEDQFLKSIVEEIKIWGYDPYPHISDVFLKLRNNLGKSKKRFDIIMALA